MSLDEHALQFNIPKDSDWELSTERLDLIPITLAHAEPLYQLFGDPLLHTYATYKIQPYPEHVERIKRWEKRTSPEGDEIWLNWIAQTKTTNEVIGHFQVGIDQNKEATLGYLVARKYHGNGFATEALRAVLKLLSAKFSVQSTKASIDPRNERSIKLVERLGMKRLEASAKNGDVIYVQEIR